jgi:hypothetical protein
VHAEATNVDLVVVPDLGCFSEPTEILARVRRMVGDEGAALVVAANRDVAANEGSRAFDYYELFDLVAKEFDCVRMIAQLPFHGVTLAELVEEDQSPTVNVDTQLADTTRSAEAFIALASQRDVRLDAYSIVELPAHPAPPPSDTVSAGAREALEEAELRSRALETQNAELSARAADRDRLAEAAATLERVLVERSEAAEQLAVVLDDRTRQLAQVERRTVALEQELHRTDAQPDEHIRFEEASRGAIRWCASSPARWRKPPSPGNPRRRSLATGPTRMQRRMRAFASVSTRWHSTSPAAKVRPTHPHGSSPSWNAVSPRGLQ